MSERSIIPFLIFGDGPRLSTGLARIARDLALRLCVEQEELGIHLAQVGVDYPGGWHWQPWEFCGFQPDPSDQGRGPVSAAIVELTARFNERPVVLMIMDPARCYDLTRLAPDVGGELQRLEARLWGYYPLDAHNRLGLVGGPAGRAVCDTDRLLGYGRYGATLLRATLRAAADRPRLTIDPPAPAVPYLPHGLDTHTFCPGVPLSEADPSFRAWAEGIPAGTLKVGCVATNQARKDLGLLFSTIAELRAQGHPVVVWLHTDKLTHIWDVGELVLTCGLRKQDVAVSVDELQDRQLAARYGWSDVTFAPGLGEGFGYPIVESLACGTPVVHGNYAGGVELLPDPGWLVEPCAWRLESVYALLRPVYKPRDVAEVLLRVGQQTQHHPARMRAYCSGAVSYLEWGVLWPRWRGWIQQGLTQLRSSKESEGAAYGT